MLPEQLLKSLVNIPSVSGNENEIADFVYDYLNENGLDAKRVENNVYCSVGKGKTLLLNSHLDTVPPSKSWKSNPYKANEANGKIYGLGACDAKASIACMICTMTNLIKSEKELGGRVIFSAVCEEELESRGIKELIKKIPSFEAAVIGEPTNLDIAVAQKGIVRAKMLSKGKSAHASLRGVNAIHKAADDIEKIKGLVFKKKHLLGYPSVQVTMINAGIGKNVIPDRCESILDIRTTPVYPNNYMINLIRKLVKSEIEIMSNRIFPKETNIKEGIVRAARLANKKARTTGFFAACDLAFIDKPGIILGPGSPNQAHSPDEFVEIRQLRKADIIYQNLIKNFFHF
jgi:acetylornithine deacetylase